MEARKTRKKNNPYKPLDFNITILGSNSAIPAHGRNQTSQLISWDGESFLIDCGESTQLQLRRFKIKYSKINHIFISHLHGDHYLGLMGLINTYSLNNRKLPLHLYGPKGLDEIITIQLKYSASTLNFPLIFHPTVPQGKNKLVEIRDLTIYSFPLEHRIPCTGFSFEEKKQRVHLNKEMMAKFRPEVEEIHTLQAGKDVMDKTGNVLYKADDFCEVSSPRKYSYCSDTVFNLDLIPHIKGSDFLYHESTFMEDEKKRAKVTKHSTAKEAAIIAKEAEVKQLLLGHYSSRYSKLDLLLKEAKEIFDESTLSVEGCTYSIK
ncbi:ribonuclease Z [Cyclobacterium marinum]|uniref:ribonuclease Z n=1 Tax=Cyclobacterium marinum TaxID=104 RepID=UPI00293D7183|nr:ribonuclease Z [Cyclobacterium marinum]